MYNRFSNYSEYVYCLLASALVLWYKSQITISNSITHVRTLLVLLHTAQFTASFLFRSQNTTVDYSSSITHVHTLLVSSHNSLVLKLSLIYHTAVSIVTSPFTLFRYYGNATNSLLCNSNRHVTIETPSRPNISQYILLCTIKWSN
jgi:hypothetical protein